jgi:hypothetical protein
MRLPMQTEFRAIVHSEYGAPEKVLRIAKGQLESEQKDSLWKLERLEQEISRKRSQNGH